MAIQRITKKERERMERIIASLNREYTTEYKVFLNHENPWQLLIATILSAQCTDERVNMVTKDLYKKYTSLQDFADAKQEELEKDIHSTGFYKNKAKNIIACARELMEKYNGEVPSDIDALTALAGVGRKTANVIRGNIFHEPSIVVDTHVKRISKRLGFTREEDPVKIEFDLMKLLPRDQWIAYNIQIITLGRTICTARNPKCEECFLREECVYYAKEKMSSGSRGAQRKNSTA
jgi:endonuclease-3